MSAKITRLNFNRMLGIGLLGSLGIVATLYAIFRLSRSATQPQLAAPQTIMLLLVVLAGLALLTGVTVWQIWRLWRRLRTHSSGARLSFSFALRMLLTALIPVCIIGSFSWTFLSYDLGRIFNREVGVALEDALQLTRSGISMRARQALEQTRFLAETVRDINYIELVGDIEAMRRSSAAQELAVFDHQGNLVAFAHIDLAVMSIDPPSPTAILQAQRNQEYFEFASSDENGYTIKVISAINRINREPFYLQAVYSMPDAFNSLAENVRESYRQHQSFLYLQPHITTSLLLVLGLIFALTILSALWISALFGDIMTRPVRELIDATKKVTEGDFSTPVTDMPDNDLGLLGNNFNAMLLTLRDAETVNNRIQDELSGQNAFLSTLLDNLTAGVLTFDRHGRLQLVNRAAARLLDTDLEPHIGQKPPRYDNTAHDGYGELMVGLHDTLQEEPDSWRREITLNRFADRRILICHGAPLPGSPAQRPGQVIVFEDITEFQQNQRNAAWEEVARRLAHEIKNPLTPIRLQSERLQRKLADKLGDDDSRRILSRATATIINQVEAMQQLVADFSQIARPLELRRAPLDVNALLREVADLYPETPVSWDLQEDLPPAAADGGQLRQVLHNLIKNAVEAMTEGYAGKIHWQSRCKDNSIEIAIEDDGPGFSDLSKDPFEPYVTTKARGTGLGLAIVKKIIGEHQGTLFAGHGKTLKGARISFTLPIAERP